YKDVSGERKIAKLKKMSVKFVHIGIMECSSQYRFPLIVSKAISLLAG
ncbi:4833_t:CDS:1, partial [Gigaspora rosea]